MLENQSTGSHLRSACAVSTCTYAWASAVPAHHLIIVLQLVASVETMRLWSNSCTVNRYAIHAGYKTNRLCAFSVRYWKKAHCALNLISFQLNDANWTMRSQLFTFSNNTCMLPLLLLQSARINKQAYLPLCNSHCLRDKSTQNTCLPLPQTNKSSHGRAYIFVQTAKKGRTVHSSAQRQTVHICFQIFCIYCKFNLFQESL